VINQSQDVGYGGIVQPNSFYTREVYILLKKNGESLEVKTNTKSVLKAFDIPSLKSEFKKQKIKIRSEEELIEAAKYLNSRGV
jgi:hypothetical protein